MASTLLETIISDAQIVTTLLPVFITNLSKNPTFLTISTAIDDVIAAISNRNFSFNVDGYTITAKLNGSPTPLTPSAAILGVEKVLSGQTGVFTSGDIEIDIQSNSVAKPAIAAAA